MTATADRELPLTRLDWSAAGREAQERMDFHESWGKATDRLAVLANAI
jgi:hypothetical protein